MEKESQTVTALINATETEMVRLNYKPSVLKQFNVVWKRLKTQAGAMDVKSFTVQFGMDFLEKEFQIFSNPLTDATTTRWMKAIYLLSDFKRTGVLTLRMPTQKYIFAEEVRDPFLSYILYQKSIGLSSKHIHITQKYILRDSPGFCITKV